MITRVKWWALGAAVVLAVGAAIWWFSQPVSPDEVAARLERAVSVGDWELVFENASEKEKRSSGLTRDQFCALMEALSSGVEDRLAGVKIRNCTEDSRVGYRVGYTISFPTSPGVNLDGIGRTYPLLFGRFDRDRWYFDLGAWPVAVSWVYPGDLRRQLLHFADCLEMAGIAVLWRFDAPVNTTPARLRQVADGAIPFGELWTSRGHS